MKVGCGRFANNRTGGAELLLLKILMEDTNAPSSIKVVRNPVETEAGRRLTRKKGSFQLMTPTIEEAVTKLSKTPTTLKGPS